MPNGWMRLGSLDKPVLSERGVRAPPLAAQRWPTPPLGTSAAPVAVCCA
eukprot:COSAG02_NODE_27263_length_613_cov_1.365759_1_plen_48_part_01